MRRVAGWGLGVVLLLGFGCSAVEDLLGGSADKKAIERVEYVFDTVSQQGRVNSKEFQTAVCRFFKDKIVISDSAEFEMAYDAFEEFLNQGGLAKGLQYSIDEYEEGEGGFVFYGKANGQKYELLVPEKRAFRWRQAPKSDF